jgi:hypothetical protein
LGFIAVAFGQDHLHPGTALSLLLPWGDSVDIWGNHLFAPEAKGQIFLGALLCGNRIGPIRLSFCVADVFMVNPNGRGHHVLAGFLERSWRELIMVDWYNRTIVCFNRTL